MIEKRFEKGDLHLSPNVRTLKKLTAGLGPE